MKKYAAIFLGIVIILVFIYAKSSVPDKKEQSAATKTYEESLILLTEKGFEPSEMTIKAGTAARWRNNTLSDASVNSDDYPTNKIFPGLNLGKFRTEQTLVYIFTKAGIYKYHDHLHPSRKGTIIVK
jgi:plastocyanin